MDKPISIRLRRGIIIHINSGCRRRLSESGFYSPSPHPSWRNGYNNGDCRVDCPNLIEPLSPIVVIPFTGKRAIREFVMTICILGKGTKRDGKEKRNFTE